MPRAGRAARIAVQRRAIITGDQIADASQGFDRRPTAARSVTVSFDSAGSHRFARVTQENVDKPFAIILDNVVISAPNINEPILGGTASDLGQLHRRERQPARHLAALGPRCRSSCT